MPLQIQTANILTFPGDVIIHPVYKHSNESVPIDDQIYRKGGPFFYLACSSMKLLRYGKAAITGSGKLACRYVIHTAVPGKPRDEDEEKYCGTATETPLHLPRSEA